MPGTIQSKIALLANFIIELPPVCSLFYLVLPERGHPIFIGAKDVFLTASKPQFLLTRNTIMPRFVNSTENGCDLLEALPGSVCS
jgi:hypothetical protein